MSLPAQSETNNSVTSNSSNSNLKLLVIPNNNNNNNSNSNEVVVNTPIKKAKKTVTAKPVSQSNKKVVKTTKTAVPTSTATPLTSQVTTPVKEMNVVNEKVAPIANTMDFSELLINFSKGSVNLYVNSLTKIFNPLLFLINNGVIISKGIAHLSIPLLMTYLFLNHVGFVTETLQQYDNRGIGMAYAVLFYLSSALIWFTSCIFVSGLFNTAKNGIFNIAKKGKMIN